MREVIEGVVVFLVGWGLGGVGSPMSRRRIKEGGAVLPVCGAGVVVGVGEDVDCHRRARGGYFVFC
jgi:hypothetical protein